jgi:hypothetical protein
MGSTYGGGIVSGGHGGRHGGRRSGVDSTLPPTSSNAQWLHNIVRDLNSASHKE